MEQLWPNIPKEEGYLVEFKDFSGGISVKELAKTLSSFANTDGGEIYLGVTDQRQIKGMKITAVLLDHIQNGAREGCTPPVPIKLEQISTGQNRSVIKIVIEKSGHLHSTAAGQTYIRVGTQDKRVLGEELLRLAETKSQVSYEETPLDAGLEIIDLDALNQYYEARKSVSSIGRSLGPENLLLKMGLGTFHGEKFYVKAGAFILFGKEGEEILLQRDFTFVKYDREEGMYSYREDISLPAVKLLDRLMELIRPVNRRTEGLKGLTRQEKVFFPEEAIREVLLNAFAHRDYRISGLKNECRLYPNRLEVISAGSLPGIITLENIGSRHYSRNPKIMHALLILGLTEELGQGITLMKNSLKKNGNPSPEFTASSDQFKVLFYKPRGMAGDFDVKKTLDDFFAKENTLSRKQIEALTGLGTTSAKYLIQDLLKKGYLKSVGRGPSTRYQKT